jgi:hypothetical protein
MTKMLLLIFLIFANLLCCIANRENWREGRISLLLIINTILNPAGMILCLFALYLHLT